MRTDMAKVVTERPRHGHHNSYKHTGRRAFLAKQFHRDMESMPTWESIEPRGRGRDRKEFSDLLGPLQGYLTSKVGELWDNVFSEICQNLPSNSIQGRHIRSHVEQYVETNPVKIGNNYYETYKYWRSWRTDYVQFGPGNFYVDDRGVLRQGTYRPHYPKKTDPNKFSFEGLNYERHNKIWYEIRYGKRSWWAGYNNMGGFPVYNTETIMTYKKQLSTQALRQLGLKNG